MKLRAMDVDEINDFLLLKGWKFIKTENNQTQWAYGKGLNKASYWFSLFKIDNIDIEKSYYNYANDFVGNYIIYQTSYTNTLSSLKIDLTKAGFKKTNIVSKTNNIKTEYASNNYKAFINFRNGTEEYDYNENNFYTIEIHKLESLAKRRAKLELEKNAEKLEKRINNTKASIDSIDEKFVNLFDENYNRNSEEQFSESINNKYPSARAKTIKKTLVYEYPFKTDNPNDISIEINEVVAVLDNRKFGVYCYVYYGNERGFIKKQDLDKYQKSQNGFKKTVKPASNVKSSGDNKTKLVLPVIEIETEKKFATVAYLTTLWENSQSKTDNQILEILNRNLEVEIIDEKRVNGMLKVKYNNLIGWVTEESLILFKVDIINH
ncbi:MAG: hypothetical protein ACEQSR_03670 [Candidatus Methylacidiphilales bacterium]